jgi:uncharacterized protein YjbK
MLYSEAGLLSAMENAGKEIENEQERKALQDTGIGTAAIRLLNNLFTDYAGTEVGGDLIVLQKNTAKSFRYW